MYALVNVVFGFPLGKIKRNGKVKGKPKMYCTPEELAKAYCRLTRLQRMLIVPAELNRDGTYTRIEFTS